MTYNRNLMKAILSGRAQIAKAVNATVISLDDAPKGYSDFDKGAAKKIRHQLQLKKQRDSFGKSWPVPV